MDMISDKEAAFLIKSNITKLALRKYESVDLRTLTVLHKNKILTDIRPEDDEGLVVELNTPNHPNRAKSSPGPLLFRYISKNPVQLDALNISSVLFAPNNKLRRAAFDYIYNLKEQRKPHLLKRTVALFESLKESLVSEEDRWRDAAVKLFDAANDDWHCSRAALVQSLEKNFTQGIEEYLTKLLRPSISSINSIEVSITAAGQQKEQLNSLFTDMVNKNSDFTVALDEYMQCLGHLPLAKPFSLSSFVDHWQGKYQLMEDVWEKLWKWADSYSCPLPRYHVCMYFIDHPENIPQDKLTDLWNEIIEIIFMPKDENEDLRWTQSWRFFSDLASHYSCSLENHLPYKEGERISSVALWLANQVCSIFDADKENIRHLRNETFMPDFVNSANLWQLASPPIAPSILRHAVINCNRIFSMSLLPALEVNLDSLNPGLLEKDHFAMLTNTLLGTMMSLVPHKYIKSENQVYAFEKTCIDLAKKWLHFLDEKDEKKEMFAVLTSAVDKIYGTEKVSDLLRKIPDSNHGDQLLIAQYFMNLVYFEDPPLDDLWDLMNQTQWRKAVLQDSHPPVLAVLFKAFNEIENRFQFIQDRWTYNLPHYYAMACEVVEDKKRKEYLFSCVVRSSLCGNTASGIQRLLKGENRFQYESYIEFWKKHLKDAMVWSPGWIKARIRPILAVLDT